MAKIKMTCPHCGRSFEYPKRYRGNQISCPACKHLVSLPRGGRKKLLIYLLIPVVITIVAVAWLVWPGGVSWPDHRPIGVLFLASDAHASAKNPRGWFNQDNLDVTGPGGQERFQKALMDYADSSIDVLKRIGAQGVIVWDVEGEEYPHKTTFIGDPRLVGTLAPEMAPVVNEFFKKFRDAGFRVGVTIRPQQLVFDHGIPRQSAVLDIKGVLQEKIDYARTNWGATLFYIDSNYSFFRPDEAWQLRLLAAQRPDVLLIPEHNYFLYRAFSAPYVPVQKLSKVPGGGRKLFPASFQALNISDASPDQIAAAWHEGDILLFRAWYWNSDCEVLEKLKPVKP
jgi:hypothetical protein